MQALRDELKDLIVEALKLDDLGASEIGDEEPLFGEVGLGLDSLDVLELAVALEYRFGFRLQLDAEEGRRVFAHVSSLAEFVQENRTK